MSILIKGMEMPTNCHFCEMYEADMYWCRAAKRDIDSFDDYDNRSSFCPLVPVPKHGRLIDADALAKDDWYLNRYVSDSNGCWIENMTLEDAPTIIPADEPFGKSEQLNVKGE